MPVPVEWPDGARERVPARAVELQRATERLARMAEADLRRAPREPLYESAVRYERDARTAAGDEQWRVPSQIGQGTDCKNLSAWRVAELRLAGERARTVVRRTGPSSWHALVRRADGRIEDPSRRLGMGVHELGGISVVGAPRAPRGPRNATITWSAARQRDGSWRGEVRCALVDGSREPIGRGEGRSRQSALARAVNQATSVLDNPAARALLPPQATAALAVLRSKPVAKAAKGALRFARRLGLRL